MSYIDTKIISLTSQSATTKLNDTYLSNVRYELANILNDSPDIIHRQIQLLHAQIPYSFYVINYTNNLFRYDLGSGIVNVTIPVGNYNANSLILAIKNAVNQSQFLIQLSSINGKLTFTYNTSFIIYNNFKYSIGSVLGFAENSINNSIANSITCPYPCNLLGIKNLQIRSDTLNMNNISSLNGGQTILLSTIPVSCVPFGMIDYTDSGKNLISISNTTLDEINLEIIDGESGEFINFNNQDWCITFALHITRLIEPLIKSTFKTIKENQTPDNLSLRFNPSGTPPLEPSSKINQKDLEEFNLLNE